MKSNGKVINYRSYCYKILILKIEYKFPTLEVLQGQYPQNEKDTRTEELIFDPESPKITRNKSPTELYQLGDIAQQPPPTGKNILS